MSDTPPESDAPASIAPPAVEPPKPPRDDRKVVLEYAAELEAEIALHPEWPDLRHKAAVARMLVREPEAAKALLLPVVEKHPSYVDGARALAFAHLALGDAKAGIEAIIRLEEAAGKNHATALARGLFCAAAKKKGAAREALAAAVGFEGAGPLARYAHVHACEDDDRGSGAVHRAEADALHFQDVGIASQDRQFMGNPARALVFRELAGRAGDAGDAAGATRYMDLAFSLDLDVAADAAARADLALSRGKVEEAATGYRRAIEKDPSVVRARSSLAYALVLLGDGPGALAALEEATTRRPAWADLRRQKGELLLDLGETARAVEELSQAVELNPKYGAARFALGRARLAAGDAAGAALDLALACVGDQPDVAKEVALSLHAQALMQGNDLAGAERSAQDALAIDGTLPEPHMILALAAAARGDLKAAGDALAAFEAHGGAEEDAMLSDLRKRLLGAP